MTFALFCLVIGVFIIGVVLIAMYNMQVKRLDIIRDVLDKSYEKHEDNYYTLNSIRDKLNDFKTRWLTRRNYDDMGNMDISYNICR